MFEGESLCLGKMFELINTGQPRTIIELGVNHGTTSEFLLQRMNKDEILYGIEADPRCIVKIKNKIKDPRFYITHAAVTDEDIESIEFHLCTAIHPGYGPWDCASSLKPIKHGLVVNPWLKYEEDVYVAGISLDTFTKCSFIDKVDFIWCDVEGAYAEVVDGGLETLKRTKYFYTECEDVETYEGEIMYPAMKTKMESIGWELVHRFKYDALFINKEFK